jgi:hypothetical protein
MALTFKNVLPALLRFTQGTSALASYLNLTNLTQSLPRQPRSLCCPPIARRLLLLLS